MTKRARAFALTVAAVGTLVLVVVPALYWDTLLERYYVSLLDAGTEKTRLDAAAWLGKKRSAAAIPRLFRLLPEEPRENYTVRSGTRELTPVAHAIYTLGVDAKLSVVAAIDTEKRKLLALAPGPMLEALLSVLYFVWQEPVVSVVRIEYNS